MSKMLPIMMLKFFIFKKKFFPRRTSWFKKKRFSENTSLINPTWRRLGPGAVFKHSPHVLTSFEASQKQMLQLDLTMLNFGNSGINYPNLLLTYDYFFKQVENILLNCVDFSNNMVLLLSTRFFKQWDSIFVDATHDVSPIWTRRKQTHCLVVVSCRGR